MKRVLICILLILLILPFSSRSAAAENEKEMVYLSGEELDRIYALTTDESFVWSKSLKSDSLMIVRESIMPIYTIDMYEFAETGKFEVKPMWVSIRGEDNEGKGNFYAAKLINEKKQFAGNIIFNVEEDGETNLGNFLYAPGNPPPSSKDEDVSSQTYYLSYSYADHAERIKNILNSKEIISPNDVKLLSLPWVGMFFYVKNENYDILIPTGTARYDGKKSDSMLVDRTVNPYVELKAIADNLLADADRYKAEKEAWEKEHPGEIYQVYGEGFSGASEIVSGCSSVNNIINISEYFSVNNKTDGYLRLLGNDVNNYIYICLASITIASVSLHILVLIKKRKKQ